MLGLNFTYFACDIYLLFNNAFLCVFETTPWLVTNSFFVFANFQLNNFFHKSCLGVFKSLNTLEKNVDTCKLEYDHKETRIVFKLFCRHGT